MRKVVSLMMFLIAWMGVSERAAAQMKPLNMPEGKYINSLKVYDDTLFAACSDGVYCYDMKQANGWQPYAFDGERVVDFVKSGKRMLAMVWEERVYANPEMIWYKEPYGTKLLLAEGKGQAAEDVTPGWVAASCEGCFFSLAQDGDNPDLIYMSCTPTKEGEYPNEYYAVFKSRDFGSNWHATRLTLQSREQMEQQILAGPPCIHVDKQNGRVYVYGAPAVDCLCHFLYVSDDQMETIQMMIDMFWFDEDFSDPKYERPSMHTQVIPSPFSSNEFLLKTQEDGVWKSTGGLIWHQVTDRFAVDGVFYDEDTSGVAYYMRTVNREGKAWMQLYQSVDGGETWTLWKEEPDVQPQSIMMYQGSLYFQNIMDGEVYQWSLKDDAQDEKSFLKEGKRWNYVTSNGRFGNHLEFTVRGDTLIGGQSYKKLYQSTNEATPSYYCAMREQDGKVYKVAKGKEVEEVLFDFNAAIGDVVFSEKYDYVEHSLTVTDIDYVTVCGVQRKRLLLTASESFNDGADRNDNYGEVYIVEGIGSAMLFDYPEGVFLDGLWFYLVDCSEDNQVIFRNVNFYRSGDGEVVEGDVTGYTVETLDQLRHYNDLHSSILQLQGSVVVKVQGDRIIVADKESGAVACLFGTGADLQEGTELGGRIKGIVGECNGLMCLFPKWVTDVSTIEIEGAASSDVTIESFTAEELQGNDFNYLFQVVNVKSAQVKSLDDGVYIVGANDEKLVYVNDVFGTLSSLPSEPVDLVGCISPRPYSKATRTLIPLKSPLGEADMIGVAHAENHSENGIFDLQGRRMNNGSTLPKGLYIAGGKKFVVR